MFCDVIFASDELFICMSDLSFYDRFVYFVKIQFISLRKTSKGGFYTNVRGNWRNNVKVWQYKTKLVYEAIMNRKLKKISETEQREVVRISSCKISPFKGSVSCKILLLFWPKQETINWFYIWSSVKKCDVLTCGLSLYNISTDLSYFAPSRMHFGVRCWASACLAVT